MYSLDTTALLDLLAAVQESGAIAQGARSLGLSYRHAWGQIKAAEALFGIPGDMEEGRDGAAAVRDRRLRRPGHGDGQGDHDGWEPRR